MTGELLLLAADLEGARRQHDALTGLGLKLRRRLVLAGLDTVLSVFVLPPWADHGEILAVVQARFPEAGTEYNQSYDLLGSASGRQYAARMAGFTRGADAGVAAGEGVVLAMLDAPVDASHPALAGRRIEIRNVAPWDPSAADAARHGTAVASLLVGDGDVLGALPAARLLAVNIFAQEADGVLRTRTDRWLQGLDAIAVAHPRPTAVNMSFGGPPSRLVAGTIARLHAQGLHFVAAAGNGGPDSAILFPASLEEVIAVTAVDAGRRIYADAPHGAAIDLAAPGVDVWVAGPQEGYYASGTSFAAPWVTAAVASAVARGLGTVALFHAAEDLGPPGRDVIYGMGLLRVP